MANRKYHSAEKAPLSVTDDLPQAFDEKKISILVLMELSKAFDSVNHDIVIQNSQPWCVSISARIV